MARRHSSTAPQRAQWVAQLLAAGGEYGIVTRLSDEGKVSRQSLYTWRAQGRAALEASFAPRPRETPQTAPLTRAILTLWADGHASYRGIQTCLQELLGCHVSLGHIAHVLHEAQQRALTWFTQHAPPQARPIALDELYAHTRQAAYLSMVDALGYAVWATCGPLSVDGESWQLVAWEAQDAGLAWHTLVSDGERAILDVCAKVGAEATVQRDVWHVLHRCAQACDRLQARLTYLQQRAHRTTRYADRVAAGERPKGRPPKHDVETQGVQVQAAQRVVHAVRYLGHELKRLLEVVVLDRRGVLTSVQRRTELDTWLELVAELRETAPTEMQDELDALHTHVRLARDGLLAFTPALDAVQQVAAVEIGPAALAVLAWAWQRRAILAPHRDDLLAGLAEGWRPTAQRLMAAWDAVVRTSSAIENWHSILRPHLAVHRTLSPGLLALLAVWHNHRVFPRGVHTGLNPLHLSGLTDAPTDWLVALGYSPARTSSTHLTCPSSLSRLALAA